MRKKLGILVTLLCMVTLLGTSSIFAEAEVNEYYDDSYDYCIYIYDEAELFSNKEINRLVDTMTPIAEDYGNVCVLTLLWNDYSNTKQYAEAFTREYFDKENMVLFIIDTSSTLSPSFALAKADNKTASMPKQKQSGF